MKPNGVLVFLSLSVAASIANAIIFDTPSQFAFGSIKTSIENIQYSTCDPNYDPNCPVGGGGGYTGGGGGYTGGGGGY